MLALLRLCVEHVWVEEAADLLVVVFQTLQDQQRRDVYEDFRVALFELLSKRRVFFSRRLDDLRKVKQLGAFPAVQEVGESLAPRVFELYQHLHELRVVLQLGVDHFNVQLVLPQERFEILKYFFNSLGQVTNCARLGRTNSATNAFSRHQNFIAQVIAPHSLGIGDGVDLAQNGDELRSLF